MNTHPVPLTYPTRWEYRIIGRNEHVLKGAISAVMGSREYALSFSNSSKQGSYISLALSTIVESEEARTTIYDELKKRPEVIVVL